MDNVVKFWLVWRELGGSPSKAHLTLEDAKAEANRLSEKHVGERFFVLEPKYFVQSSVMVNKQESDIAY